MASRTITRVEYTSNRVGKTRKSVFFGTVLVALVVAALNTPLSLRGNYYALGQPSADFNHMIVFTRWHDGMPEVFVMNNDGTGQRGLGARGLSPTWSPLGDKIAFFKNANFYTINSDGTGLKQLTFMRLDFWPT